jgi:hypothetical protein
MLRLNTSIPPAAKGQQSRLGVLAGDNAGFPNGRRPGDDVVDIELRVAMGVLCTINLACKPADAPSGAVHFTDGRLMSMTLLRTRLSPTSTRHCRFARRIGLVQLERRRTRS